MFVIFALLQALAGGPEPVLAGTLFCLGEQPLPPTFVQEAPGKETWRLAGCQNILVSKVGSACLVTRFPVGVTETATSAWIEAHPDFQVDKDATAAGSRTREYARTSGADGLRLRLTEPVGSEYSAFSPPSGVVIWPVRQPR